MSRQWPQVALLVEGQTEEALVDLVLTEFARRREVVLKPIIVATKRTSQGTHKGGGGWQHMRDDVCRLAPQTHWRRIGLMFDVYGSEFAKDGSPRSGTELHAYVLQQAEQSLLQAAPNLTPDRLAVGPVLHEFETLVLAAIASGGTSAASTVVREVEHAVQHVGDFEQINGSPQTSPSHRLREWWLEAEGEEYSKALYGPSLIDEAGIDEVLDRCPTFMGWLDRLLAP